MANINFAVFNAFRRAGVEEDVAREAAEAVAEAAASRDLSELRAVVERVRDEIRQDFEGLRREIDGMRRQDIEGVRRESDGVRQRLVRLEERIDNLGKMVWIVVGAVMVNVVVTLLKGGLIP